MASNPAPTATPSAPVPLWPAPVFVLGACALAAVWFCRPIFPACIDCIAGREIQQAKQQLERPDGDLEFAAKLARRALDASHSAEAALLLGRVHLRQAETSGDWASARPPLEQAQKGESTLGDGDRAELELALAKVDFHTGQDPSLVTKRLEPLAEASDARAEVFDLLTRAYLRLPQPALEQALEANKKHREVAELSAAEMAHAQLTGGELLLRLNKPHDARESLKRILDARPQAAPLSVLVRARLLLARSFQDERFWEKAIEQYRGALTDSRSSVPQPAQVYYNLGVCYSHNNQPREAADAGKRITLAQGEEAQAAAVAKAEIALLGGIPDAAVKDLTAAVAAIGPDKAWDNKLVDLSRVREVFEGAITKLREKERPDLALAALEPYARIAAPRQLLTWRGLLSAEQARAKDTSKPEAARLHRQAAAAYGEAAALPKLLPVHVADFLWAAVPCHLAAGEGEAALAKLVKLTGMNIDAGRMAEVNYLLAEEYRAAGQKQQAEAAYEKCVENQRSRFAYLARFQIARLMRERGEIDACLLTLEENLKLLTWEADAEAMSQTLFLLCDLLYGQRKYGDIVRKAEAALHLKDHLANRADAALAAFQLADSYRQVASQEYTKQLIDSVSPENAAHFERQRERWLRKAAEEFGKLDEFLDSPAGMNCLSLDQRAQVPVSAAKCWHSVKEHDKALALYEKLIGRTKGKPERLEAMGGAVECLAAKSDANGVKQRLVMILGELSQHPDDISKPWKEWVDAVMKGLKDVIPSDEETNVDVPVTR